MMTNTKLLIKKKNQQINCLRKLVKFLMNDTLCIDNTINHILGFSKNKDFEKGEKKIVKLNLTFPTKIPKEINLPKGDNQSRTRRLSICNFHVEIYSAAFFRSFNFLNWEALKNITQSSS